MSEGTESKKDATDDPTPIEADEAGAGTAAEAETAPPESAEEDDKAALEARLAEVEDRLLRALAETENVRRRAEKERGDAARYGATALAKDLLSVCDNLRRALDSVGPDDRAADARLNAFAEGVELTERELLAAFTRNGIVKVEPLDVPFDYDRHQAMMQVENSGKPKGTVVQLLQPGYVLHDRLLRPAMVGVAAGDPGGDAPKKVDTTV
ncbi:MAG: nucleotide exchange factor GrpE [Alphaproteobacteria bacterium]